MKVVSFLALPLSLALAAGCGSKEGDGPPAKPGASGSAASTAAGNAVGSAAGAAAGYGKVAGSAAAAPAAAGDSFFAGEVPAGVKMKATKTFAIDPGILMIQGVEGWTGGQLGGYEYMTMSKDTTATGRVATSPGVTGEMGCAQISTAAAMAPLKAKNLKESVPAVMRQVGKNKFVAREGVCTADGPKGPLEVHFLNILRKDKGDLWHYAVIVGFPSTAAPELKNEAMAWARSLEYNGGNGYTMP